MVNFGVFRKTRLFGQALTNSAIPENSTNQVYSVYSLCTYVCLFRYISYNGMQNSETVNNGSEKEGM